MNPVMYNTAVQTVDVNGGLNTFFEVRLVRGTNGYSSITYTCWEMAANAMKVLYVYELKIVTEAVACYPSYGGLLQVHRVSEVKFATCLGNYFSANLQNVASYVSTFFAKPSPYYPYPNVLMNNGMPCCFRRADFPSQFPPMFNTRFNRF